MKSFEYMNLLEINEFERLVKDKENEENNKNDDKILKVNTFNYKSNENKKYKLIKYKKELLKDDFVSTYGLLRSVILNNENNVVSFAPPKSVSFDIFIKKYLDISNSNIQIQEFIEGTMINVFWDSSIEQDGNWEIATRSTIGAENSFYKSYEKEKENTKTFKTMFLEASKECDLILENLDKNYCYSFVLQHPENRIVVPFSKPNLYLVAVYSIKNEENSIIINSHDIFEIKKLGLFENTKFDFPKIYDIHSYEELREKYASITTSYDCLGAMIINNETGERTKIRNPTYEEIRNLRGNQSKIQYQYLCLRNQGKVKDFLKYYPENKIEFLKQRENIHIFTNKLFQNYISCYIKKEKPLIEYEQQFRKHMFNIHKIYLEELKEKKLYVNKSVIILYVNNLHPSLLMHTLNMQYKKNIKLK